MTLWQISGLFYINEIYRRRVSIPPKPSGIERTALCASILMPGFFCDSICVIRKSKGKSLLFNGKFSTDANLFRWSHKIRASISKRKVVFRFRWFRRDLSTLDPYIFHLNKIIPKSTIKSPPKVPSSYIYIYIYIYMKTPPEPELRLPNVNFSYTVIYAG